MSAESTPPLREPRQPVRRPGVAEIALVAIGGAVGVAAREAIVLAVPAVNGIPVAILAINVVGAFLLGVLAEALLRAGEDSGSRRRARLLVGTGMLGGFTTYSALAADGAVLLAADPLAGVGYTVGTLVLGALATFAGIAAGAAIGGLPGGGVPRAEPGEEA